MRELLLWSYLAVNFTITAWMFWEDAEAPSPFVVVVCIFLMLPMVVVMLLIDLLEYLWKRKGKIFPWN